MRTGLVAVTVTPGNTAPVASFTTPAIPASCARTGEARINDPTSAIPTIHPRVTRAIAPPHGTHPITPATSDCLFRVCNEAPLQSQYLEGRTRRKFRG